MSFSNIALQQRERESKALRIFLACTLAGSLLFHLALLASGITKYLNRVPEIEQEPVEITLLDTPIEEIEPEEEKPPEPEKIEPKQEKPPEPEPKPEPEPEPEPNITQDTPSESQISGGSQAPPLFNPIPTQPRVATQPPPVVEQPLPKLDIPLIKPISPPVVQQQPVIPQREPEPEPILESKLSDEFKIPTTTPVQPPIPQPTPTPLKELQPVPEPKLEPIKPPELPIPTNPPVQPPIPTPQPKPELQARTPQELPIPTTPPVDELQPIPQTKPEPIKPRRELPIPTNPPVQPPSQPTQSESENLKDTLSEFKENQENPKISSNNTAPSLPETSNSNSNTSDIPTRRRRIIAGSNTTTTPNSTDSGIGEGTGDSVGDGEGRAACRQCDFSYPRWAQRNRIEGKIEVSVDTDADGNVTNVRLIKGIGNDRLEKHLLKEARNWKIKSAYNGQRVRIVTKYKLR